MPQGRRGFSLIELILVVVMIGVLATIAVPKFTGARDKAFIASVMSDLKVLASQMEVYQSTNQNYATNVASLTDFSASRGVNLTITEATTGTGWAATGYHSALSGRQCGIFYGNASAANVIPATLAGTVMCQ